MITDRFLRLYQVIGDKKRKVDPIIPVSKTTWWNGVSSGRFPAPIKIGRISVWRESDIAKLIET